MILRTSMALATTIGIATACSAPAQAALPASGRFETLSLAVAPNGAVTGAYAEEQGEGVTKNCAFAVAGRVGPDGRGTVAAWVAGEKPRAGRIVGRANAVVLTVPGARDFPGCGLVLMPEIDRGLELSRTSRTRWTGMMRIATPRARLYPQAAGGAARGYLVRGDMVGVNGRNGARVAVDYVSPAGRTSSGWVAGVEVAPVSPPR